MQRKPLATTATFCLLLKAFFFAGCGGGGEAEVITIAHGLPEDHPVHQSLLEARAYLVENGVTDLQFRLFPNNQLGSSVELAQMISQGNVDVGVISAASVARVAPELNLLSLPFLFRDSDHQQQVLRGAIGDEVLEFLRPRGIFGLGYFTAGSRNIMTKGKAVRAPEDLAGMKIRVMESAVLVETISAMGGAPVAMDMGEVYSALQQGLLDGWENNPATAFFYRIYETGTDQFSWTHHLMVPDVVVASRHLESRLTGEQMEHLKKAFARAVERQWESWSEFREESIAALQAEGMEFHQVDTAAFQARVSGIYDRAFEQHGAEFRRLVEAIREQ